MSLDLLLSHSLLEFENEDQLRCSEDFVVCGNCSTALYRQKTFQHSRDSVKVAGQASFNAERTDQQDERTRERMKKLWKKHEEFTKTLETRYLATVVARPRWFAYAPIATKVRLNGNSCGQAG